MRLAFDEPHRPAGDDNGADQEHEAEGSKAEHHLGGGASGAGVGSQSASSFGQNGVTGQPNSPTNGTTGTASGSGTSGSTNPNSSTPNPF